MKTHTYILVFGLLITSSASGAPCTAPRAPQTFYVSTAGHDSNDGAAPATAFRNVQTGVNCLTVPGDRLRILPGTYTEFVTVNRKKGEPGKPIVIEGMSGGLGEPAVTIQGSITTFSGHTFQFHLGSPTAPNNEWTPVGNDGEYVSAHSLPSTIPDWQVHQGAFVNPVNGRHTRLIVYDRVEDLRSANETFEKIVDGCPTQDPRPGPILLTTPEGCTERRPWVYMGPGLWFNKATDKVHIRLSPTHNSVPGLADYAGETDPNKLPLAIAAKNMYTLTVEQSANLQFKNLAIKFSSVSLFVKDSTGIAFDGLTVWAGRYGARAGRTTRLTFTNCVFDGGLPTWMFRGDLKDQYKFLSGGVLVDNVLGKQTMETLIGMEEVSSVDIHHSEFANAHDLYLQAGNVNFHHNWIGNLNDEALFLDGAANASGLAHHNVIEQALAGISFAGDYLTGPWRVFRNLVDLRLPTAGFRPRNRESDRSHVWRNGAAFKGGNKPEGPYDIFQNTFVVPFAAEFPEGLAKYPQASFVHLRNAFPPLQSRSSLNNVFVVLNRVAGQEAPLAFLLPPNTCQYCPEDPAPSPDFFTSLSVEVSPTVEINGDLFYRRGYGSLLFATPFPGDPDDFHLFSCTPTENCMDKWRASAFFQSTENADPPGYEAQTVLFEDPRFIFWAGEPDPKDDFRLNLTSPARGAGVPLPAHLLRLDLDASGVPAPDIGAYQTSPGGGLAPELKVGVRGRKAYPQSDAKK